VARLARDSMPVATVGGPCQPALIVRAMGTAA